MHEIRHRLVLVAEDLGVIYLPQTSFTFPVINFPSFHSGFASFVVILLPRSVNEHTHTRAEDKKKLEVMNQAAW